MWKTFVWVVVFFELILLVSARGTHHPNLPPSFRFKLPGRSYVDDDDDEESSWFGASGREFNVFGSRCNNNHDDDDNDNDDESESKRDKEEYDDDDDDDDDAFTPRGAWRRAMGASPFVGRRSFTQIPRSGYSAYPRGFAPTQPTFFQAIQDWWSNNLPNFPKLQCRIEPTTTLKIRKTFRPLGTIVRMGADFNTQLGVWQFKSSWEDAIIGGKLMLAGKELRLTKSWQLSMGPMEDLVTRLRLRAAVDLETMKAYVRVGFRTEQLSPISIMEGFTLQKRVPLDGSKGNIKLEVKANVALPEPEVEYSTENNRSVVGMGDIEVNIEEMNLLLDY